MKSIDFSMIFVVEAPAGRNELLGFTFFLVNFGRRCRLKTFLFHDGLMVFAGTCWTWIYRKPKKNNVKNHGPWFPVDFFTWLVVWLPFFIFPYILGMSSSQLTFLFFRGVQTTNQLPIQWFGGLRVVPKPQERQKRMAEAAAKATEGVAFRRTKSLL